MKHLSAYSLLLVLLLAGTLFSANIVESAGGGALNSVEQQTITRQVTKYHNGTSTETMTFNFFRYGPVHSNMPLMVIFIAWGGTVSNSESRMQYNDDLNDAPITIVVGIGPDATSQTNNWYWGNVNGSESVPWAHNETIKFLNEIKYGSFDVSSVFSGAGIDTNRIYAYGHSIGGTAANQVAIKHPEIFAAYHGHAGWTHYWGDGNNFFTDGRGCLAFSSMVGGINHGDWCEEDPSITVKGNCDQTYLPLGTVDIPAYQYTDLGWYFGSNGNGGWNYRDPSFPAPFAYFSSGDGDDPDHQGDNLQPSMEESRRGYIYNRYSGGHSGSSFIRWDRFRKFRKDQSFLAFTNRNYGLNNFSTSGIFNDIGVHGWDPSTIVDETNHYYVELTGAGTADVTLRRLQHFTHTPGTQYNLQINGSVQGTITADQYGLVTIPQVADDATIDLVVSGPSAVENGSVVEDVSLSVSPNPFNPSTTIHFKKQNADFKFTEIKIEIYNLNGKLIENLTYIPQIRRTISMLYNMLYKNYAYNIFGTDSSLSTSFCTGVSFGAKV